MQRNKKADRAKAAGDRDGLVEENILINRKVITNEQSRYDVVLETSGNGEVEFRAYRRIGSGDPLYFSASHTGEGSTDSLDEARPAVTGRRFRCGGTVVKIATGEGVFASDRDELVKFGEFLARVYDYAETLAPVSDE